jgi:protoporphyrinogen oxidase
MGPNARFGYPLRGGFQALMNGFLDRIRGELKVNARVVRINPDEHELELSDGAVYRYDHLISTMPLPLLVKTLGEHAPPAVRDAASRLRHVSVRCVNLGLGRENITDKHWIYYPGKSVFHRIFVQGNASPHCNAPGGFALTCEITYSPHKPLPCEGDELIDLCIKDCISVGILRDDDPILARHQVDMPYAYVVYDHGRARNVEIIRSWLRTHAIELAGRYSEWEYYNSDHAFLAGRKAAEAVQRQDQARTQIEEDEAVPGRALEVERG